MESTLLQPLLTNIQETFQDSISVASIHELLFKAIIDLPNCKAKTTVQQSLYEKIRKLVDQSSKSNNNVSNETINAYNKQALDRQLKSLPNNSNEISKQLKKLVNDLMLSNESIKSHLLEQKMSMDFGDKMNSKTFQSKLTFLYLNAMTAKTNDDISNLLISLLDLLLKSRSLTDSIEPVIKTKLDHLLALLISNHSASLFSEHKYQNNLTNQDLYQSVLREYYLLTIANNNKNQNKADLHPLNIYLGGNNFIACNIAYELLSSNDHSKATFLFDFFLKHAVFPLPESAQKEETHIFFKYALVLKTMSQHFQKHQSEKFSALQMLVSKIMMIPTQISHWISHTEQYTEDSKSMCDSVVEKLKVHNFLSILVFVFSVDEVQRVAVLSSEKYQGEDEESMNEEQDDVNEDAPLFSIDTQGDLKRKEQTSSAKPTLDDDNFELPSNNNNDDEDDESDENSDN